MASTVEDRSGNPGTTGGWSWKKLLTVATVAAVVGLVILFVLAGIIPPLAVFAVLLLVGVVLLRAKEKPAAILLGVVHLAMFALSLPFTIPSLMVPASAIDFSLTIFLAILNLVGLGAAINVIRGRGNEVSSAPRSIATVAMVIILLGVALAVFSSVTYDNAVAQEGDIRVVTEGTDFSDTSLEADEGTVGVFIDNKDGTTHTFTIEELDVDLVVPGGKTARVSFEAEQGSYDYICVPHEEEEMVGNLSVE